MRCASTRWSKEAFAATGQLRILVRLIDTADGHLVWSGQFEPEPGEIAAAHQQIGASVAAALKLSSAPPTEPHNVRHAGSVAL